MAAILKIDGYDFYPWLRVAPEEGFDPADADFLEPQFSDTSAAEGNAIINVHAGNREMAWPLHLSPYEEAGYADTKDGLHLLLRDINRRLAAAAQIEWRDEGATASTFFDVQHARFEPDYSYRKAQKLWLSGVLRVWTKPYGHSGTHGVVGQANATMGWPVFVPVASGSLGGDVDAALTAVISIIGAPPGPVFAGVAVVPTRSVGLFPAASLVRLAGATLAGASGAVASQLARWFVGTSAVQIGAVDALDLTTAAVASGRHRVIALARVGLSTTDDDRGAVGVLSAYRDPGNSNVVIGPTQTIEQRDWLPVDLGVYGQDGLPGTRMLRLQAGAYSPTTLATNIRLELGGILMLPEDKTIVTLTGGLNTSATRVDFVFGASGPPTFDDSNGLGQPNPRSIVNDIRGRRPGIPVGASPVKVMAFAYRDDVNAAHNKNVSVLVSAQERFTYFK